MNIEAINRDRQAVPQLYEALRERIVSLEFMPGMVISRSKLADAFEVSQTPIREALHRLAEERLVDVLPQSSTRVSLISVAFAQETHFLRRSIELELVRELALNPDDILIQKLLAQLERQKALRDIKDYAAFAEADHAFHRNMYVWANKDALWNVVRSRSGDLDRVRRLHLPVLGKPDLIIDDHTRIVQAIIDRQPEKAQQALRAHMSGTPEHIASIQAAHPSYFNKK
jgi:DNA-binding GntR family transcriptional regulator